MDLSQRIFEATGLAPSGLEALTGGCVGEVYRVGVREGDDVVAKVAPGGGLEPEGWMLDYLARRSALPVPRVIFADDTLLVMTFVEADGRGHGDDHAADLLAALHDIDGPHFGLERDTVIGGLVQPNPPTGSWLTFFADQRLLQMARRAFEVGSLDSGALARVERVAQNLSRWLEEPAAPSLIHGDVWGGNVLIDGGRVAAFVDPAIYYADPEIEIAFTTLFSTFGERFYRRYAELRGLSDTFFEVRRDLYNLYPLLVHAVLFGAGYGRSVDGIARRLVG